MLNQNENKPQKLNLCPFCGTDLNEFPEVMVVKQAVYGEYLQWKKDNKKILGTDTWTVVRCIQCGATGPRGLTKQEAKDRWNGVHIDLGYKASETCSD